MTMNSSTLEKPLRLWPGVIFAVLVVIGYGLIVSRQFVLIGMFGGLGGALLILLWWLLFSRARWYERVGGVVLIAAAAWAQRYVVDPSIAGGGMEKLSYILAIPMISAALVGWAAVSRRIPSAGWRVAAALGAAAIGCLPWMILRTGGISGEGTSDIHWRWSKTPEERLLAQGNDEPAAAPAAPNPVPAAGAAETDPGVGAQARARRAAADREDETGGVARLPRSRSRRRDPWREHRDGLVAIAAGRALAAAGRARVVVVRGERRLDLHAGAARRRRSRVVLPVEHGRARVAAPRQHAVLGVERRGRPARYADGRRRPRLRARREGRPEFARRGDRCRDL